MLDQTQISELAEAAGITFDPTLVDEIYDIAAEYRSLTRVEPKGLAGNRKHLETVKKSLDKALEDLTTSEPETAAHLQSVYRGEFFTERLSRRVRAIATPPALSDDITAVKRLSKAIGTVLDHLPRGGPPRKEARDRLFVLLANLYERRSGTQFKYPDKRSGFRGSYFVHALAQIIDPVFTYADCELALRAAAQILRDERKLQKPA